MKPHCEPYCVEKISSYYSNGELVHLYEAWHPVLGVACGNSKKEARDAYAKWVSQIECGDDYVLALIHPEEARWKREYILRGGEGQIVGWKNPRGAERNEARHEIEARTGIKIGHS